ncbi:hypothetical protein BH10ACI1_BH10ACI1_03140 [soil metagenome]
MAALVTFIADRFPALGGSIFGLQYRVLIAVVLSIFTGWVVNRVPKVAARAFGPATAAILLLLWIMIFASLWRFGFNLPSIDFNAFHPQYLNLTLGGYARILALMTGIEIFANLVAAYGGKRAEKSRKAFGSLIIIMGTTSLTMLIVGPAIFQLANVNNAEVSVFTQTMDALLPSWASYLGTLTGIAVLLSACAASAQGLQNLALGLRYRHYIPASFGQQNKFDVADKPVWLEVALVVICFLMFGTHEETYLALYAAGVFVLLSLTGWAASKRLLREIKVKFTPVRLISLVGTIVAALLTSGATFIIFGERFFEGAWTYLIFIPVLYAAFSFYRNRLGAPNSVEDRLGIIVARQRQLLDYTDDQTNQTEDLPENLSANGDAARLEKFLIPLDGSMLAEQSLPISRKLAADFGANLILATVKGGAKKKDATTRADFDCDDYLQKAVANIKADSVPAYCITAKGKDEASEINRLAIENAADLIVISTRGKFDVGQIFSASVAQRLIEQMSVPVLLLRPTDDWKSRYSEFKRIIVALDGSAESENVLPMVKTLADKFDGEVLLVSVPEGAESETYAATMQQYLDNIAAKLESPITRTRVLLGGSGPVRTILAVAKEERADLIVLATHGRGGAGRIENLPLGSVASRVAEKTICPVLLIPVRQSSADV